MSPLRGHEAAASGAGRSRTSSRIFWATTTLLPGTMRGSLFAFLLLAPLRHVGIPYAAATLFLIAVVVKYLVMSFFGGRCEHEFIRQQAVPILLGSAITQAGTLVLLSGTTQAEFGLLAFSAVVVGAASGTAMLLAHTSTFLRRGADRVNSETAIAFATSLTCTLLAATRPVPHLQSQLRCLAIVPCFAIAVLLAVLAVQWCRTRQFSARGRRASWKTLFYDVEREENHFMMAQVNTPLIPHDGKRAASTPPRVLSATTALCSPAIWPAFYTVVAVMSPAWSLLGSMPFVLADECSALTSYAHTAAVCILAGLTILWPAATRMVFGRVRRTETVLVVGLGFAMVSSAMIWSHEVQVTCDKFLSTVIVVVQMTAWACSMPALLTLFSHDLFRGTPDERTGLVMLWGAQAVAAVVAAAMHQLDDTSKGACMFFVQLVGVVTAAKQSHMSSLLAWDTVVNAVTATAAAAADVQEGVSSLELYDRLHRARNSFWERERGSQPSPSNSSRTSRTSRSAHSSGSGGADDGSTGTETGTTTSPPPPLPVEPEYLDPEGVIHPALAWIQSFAGMGVESPPAHTLATATATPAAAADGRRRGGGCGACCCRGRGKAVWCRVWTVCVALAILTQPANAVMWAVEATHTFDRIFYGLLAVACAAAVVQWCVVCRAVLRGEDSLLEITTPKAGKTVLDLIEVSRRRRPPSTAQAATVAAGSRRRAALCCAVHMGAGSGSPGDAGSTSGSTESVMVPGSSASSSSWAGSSALDGGDKEVKSAAPQHPGPTGAAPGDHDDSSEGGRSPLLSRPISWFDMFRPRTKPSFHRPAGRVWAPGTLVARFRHRLRDRLRWILAVTVPLLAVKLFNHLFDAAGSHPFGDGVNQLLPPATQLVMGPCPYAAYVTVSFVGETVVRFVGPAIVVIIVSVACESVKAQADKYQEVWDTRIGTPAGQTASVGRLRQMAANVKRLKTRVDPVLSVAAVYCGLLVVLFSLQIVKNWKVDDGGLHSLRWWEVTYEILVNVLYAMAPFYYASEASHAIIRIPRHLDVFGEDLTAESSARQAVKGEAEGLLKRRGLGVYRMVITRAKLRVVVTSLLLPLVARVFFTALDR